ncbi:MAG TPA: tetratricopeptide repeat protein [Pyrinomonadaceae bacterium]
MFRTKVRSLSSLFYTPLICLGFTALLFVASADCLAQSAIDYTGTGGRHTIQGRIYFPSGRRADAPGLVVKLESVTNAPITVFTDTSGAFAFKNLSAGSYTIIIEGTDDYEPTSETVYIDDPGSSSVRGRSVSSSTPRTFTVPIYLSPRRRVSNKPAVVNAVLAAAPKPAADLYLAALESARVGDHKKAVEQLKSALALYPQFSLALNELGVQYLLLGQPDNAASALAEAVKLVPQDVAPRLNYGIALLNQNKFAASEEQLRMVVERNSNLLTAHMYLGIALSRQQKLDEAERELLLAMSTNSPDVALAHRFLGGVYWAKRQYQSAADQLELYLKLMPNAGDAVRTREAIKELRNKPKPGS